MYFEHFQILAVKEFGAMDAFGLYPVLPPEIGGELFVREASDGIGDLSAKVSAITIHELRSHAWRKAASLRDLSFDLIVTNSRIVLYCKKYDKGGNWWGIGPTVVVANTISKGLAAQRRRGKALVGHVKFEWLYKVGVSPKFGYLDSEILRLIEVVNMGDESCAISIDLKLSKSFSSVDLAQAIVQRAAALQLSHYELNAGARAILESLTKAEPLQPQKNQFVFYDPLGGPPKASTLLAQNHIASASDE